jgi:hypothetical protein
MLDNDTKRIEQMKSENPLSDIDGCELAARRPHLPGDGYLSSCGLFNDAVSNSKLYDFK